MQAEFVDLPAFLECGDEAWWGQQAADGVVPTREGFLVADLAVAGAHNGLIVHFKMPAFDCLVQMGDDVVAVLDFRIELFVVEAHARSGACPDALFGDARLVEQRDGALPFDAACKTRFAFNWEALLVRE